MEYPTIDTRIQAAYLAGKGTVVDTSSKETVNIGAKLRATKEVDGKIVEEETVNGFHLTTVQMVRE